MGSNPINWIDPLGLSLNNPFYSINWSGISSVMYSNGNSGKKASENNRYYSAAEIFDQLKGSADDWYDPDTNSSTLSYTFEKKTATLYYNMNDVKRESFLGLFEHGVNDSLFDGVFGRNTEYETAVRLLYHKKRAYVTKADLKAYFDKVWCEEDTAGQLVTTGQLEQIGWVNANDETMVKDLNRVLLKYDFFKLFPLDLNAVSVQNHPSGGGVFLRQFPQLVFPNTEIFRRFFHGQRVFFPDRYVRIVHG